MQQRAATRLPQPFPRIPANSAKSPLTRWNFQQHTHTKHVEETETGLELELKLKLPTQLATANFQLPTT